MKKENTENKDQENKLQPKSKVVSFLNSKKVKNRKIIDVRVEDTKVPSATP